MKNSIQCEIQTFLSLEFVSMKLNDPVWFEIKIRLHKVLGCVNRFKSNI